MLSEVPLLKPMSSQGSYDLDAWMSKSKKKDSFIGSPKSGEIVV